MVHIVHGVGHFQLESYMFDSLITKCGRARSAEAAARTGVSLHLGFARRSLVMEFIANGRIASQETWPPRRESDS